MAQIAGILLALSPFWLLRHSRDKILGTSVIFLWMTTILLGAAFLLQLTGLFTKPIYLFLVAMGTAGLFAIPRFRSVLSRLPSPEIGKPDGFLVLLAVIVLSSLYFTHYQYNGEIQMASRYEAAQAADLTYPYPYYSDEWVAVALIDDVLESGHLPVRNPFHPDRAGFVNYAVMFHAMLSGICQLFSLNPLTSYVKIGWTASLLTCVFLYLLLLSLKVRRPEAALAATGLLYITNSANFPALWYLLPINLGVVWMILSLLFLSRRLPQLAVWAGGMVLLFYPPLIVFLFPAFAFWSAATKNFSLVKALAGIVLGVTLLVGCGYLLSQFPPEKFLEYLIEDRGMYDSIHGGARPSFPVHKLLPIPALIFSALGLISSGKKHAWLTAPLMTGGLIWLIYSQVDTRIVIGYQRAVFVTCVLLVFFCGLGLQAARDIVERNRHVKHYDIAGKAGIFVLLLLLLGSNRYPLREEWKELTQRNAETGERYIPAPPANAYLFPDDYRIFQNLNQEMFLSLPWKGLVIGTVTSNYPVSIKSGMISRNQYVMKEFYAQSCPGKTFLAKRYGFRYVYTFPFDCDGFVPVEQSREGFVLFRVSN